MTTVAQARDAETFAQRQRTTGARSLTMDLAKEITETEKDLAAKVLEAAFKGDAFDKMLGRADVNMLFVRGVLKFGGHHAGD